MTYEHPMCPPSRRKILAILSAIPVATLASPAHASGPSLALLVALENLEAVRATLDLATSYHTAAMVTVDRWERDNPPPTSKKGRRRWEKKSSAVFHDLTDKPWQALVMAEGNFRTAQDQLAAIACTGAADLRLMAEAAVTYDAVELYSTNRAPISRAVARYLEARA